MNKQMKDIVRSAWCLLLGVTVSAEAATSVKKTTTDANGITWNYILTDGIATLGWGSTSTPATDAGGDLVIPPTLDGYPVRVIGEWSFRTQNVTSVVIPSSVEEVDRWAFDWSAEGLKAITNLVIPASIKKFGVNAFDFHSPPNLTVRFESMKAWCEAEGDRSGDGNPMYSAKRTYFGTEAVQDSGDLVIPEGTERITSYAFYGYGCDNVTNIVIPASVKEIGSSVFTGFRNLKTITIPSSVQKLGNSIFGSTAPEKVVVSADFPYFENLMTVFAQPSSSSYQVAAPPQIAIAEGNPNYLQKNGGLYSADGTVFLLALKPANPPSNYTLTIADTVTRIAEKACFGATWITAVIVPAGIKEIPTYAFQACTSLKSIELSDSLQTIGNYAFSGCSKLASVNLPALVQTIGDSAFESCTSLQSIELSDSLQSIGSSAFESCTSLQSIELSDSLQSIGSSAFERCSKLTNVSLPASVETIGQYAFERSGLREIVIPDSITQMSSAFSYCTALTNVIVSSGVAAIDSYAFESCTLLRSVTVQSAETTLDSRSFSFCRALERLFLPAGTTVKSDAFVGTASAALTLVLEDGTTVFGTDYLANAPSLKTAVRALEVPPSCTKLDLVAMSQLVNLTKVVFRGESLMAIGIPRVRDLKDSGLDIGYIPEGGTEAEGAEFLEKLVLNESQVSILSSSVREGNAGVLDVRYVVTGAPETFAVRSLAFQDGERSFAKVIRPLSFADGTATNANGTVAVNEPHDIAWRFSEDWQAKLGNIALEVMTVEVAELPLKLVVIPATTDHAELTFSCNALSDEKVLDALFWHYADPNSTLTLRDGKLYDGGTLLADGTEPTAAGTAYVFAKMGYGLLSGEELDYANEILRLGLVPEGARQYAVEHPAK